MDEVGGALIAISLVLIAVFLPTAFITGLQGTFYKQFAITIAASTAISAFVSLTLSPAMAALLLKSHALSHVEKAKPGLMERLASPVHWFFRWFNRGFEALSNFYGRVTARLIRMGFIMLAIYAGLLALTQNRLASTPTGLVPTARPLLPDRCHAASRRFDARAVGRAGAQGERDHHLAPRRRERRLLRRLRRRDLHQRTQYGRDLRHPEALQGPAGSDQGYDPGRSARADVSPCARPSCSSSSRLRCPHRHRRRPQGLRAGPRGARADGPGGRHLGACRGGGTGRPA